MSDLNLIGFETSILNYLAPLDYLRLYKFSQLIRRTTDGVYSSIEKSLIHISLVKHPHYLSVQSPDDRLGRFRRCKKNCRRRRIVSWNGYRDCRQTGK